MEDERGGVGPDISVGVSEPPLSVNLPSEAPVEKMGSENRVEEPYEEGDGGEIMVEIVGSDVFVDGVSGDTEGDLGSEDVKELEGDALENREETETQNISEAMDVSSGKDENEMGELRNELDNVAEEKAVAEPAIEQVEEAERIPMVITDEIVEPVTEKVEEVERTLIVINNEEIAGPVAEHVEEVDKAPMVINEETVWSVMEQVEEVERTPMVISEEKVIRHESVDKENTDDVVKTVAVVEGKVGTAEKEESMVEQIEEAERTNVVISEEKVIKDEEVDKESANVVKSEVVEGKNDVSEEQEIVPSNDATANVQAAQTDSVAEVGSVNATEGGEVGNLSKDGGIEEENETTITDGDFGPETEPIDEREVKPVDEREVLAAESADPVLKTDEHVSDVQEEIEEADDMKCEPTLEVDDEKSLPNIMDFKDEESDIILPDEELEADLVHQNQEESTQLAEIEADTEGNQPTTAGEVTNDEKIVISQVKVVDEEKVEEIDPATSIQSCTENGEILSVNASTESVHLSAEGTASQVEMADVKVAEDHVEYNDPIINAEVGLDNVVEEQVVTVQITETSNHAVDGVSVIDETCILPEITEKEELHVSTTDFSLVDNKSEEAENNSCKNNGFYNEGHISETKLMDVDEEREADREYHGEEDHVSEIENFKLLSEETINSATAFRMKQSGYLSPPEIEGHFSPSDLVWGKVRSHPWWPGQIFDPSEASEKAVKYHKKDSYLVAYFGDRTFAWNDAAVLKPFRSYFSQFEKQSNSEAFHNAVDSVLEEVSRRVELGLACSCISKDEYSKIEAQVVENAGIREESSLRHGVDNSSKASHFEPEKLLEYITNLAPRASSGADRLDLVIAKAQLSAFCSFKGYRLPSEFPSSGELLENDEDTEQISDEMVDFDSHESKHIPKDGKERSLMELMVDGEYSPDAEEDSVSLPSVKKRKAMESLQDGSDKRASIVPKPSFKIGECIRRVASQLTGLKDETVISGSPKTENHSGRKSVFFSAESFSVDEMLSHLQLVAVDPKKGQNFQNNIRNFFMGFRSSIALNKRGRKKKAEPTVGGSGEEFEFDDVNDSYWTDRIVQNYSEEQLLQNTENAPEINNHYQIVSLNAEKAVKTTGRKPHSRKRYSTGNYPTEAMEIDESVKRRKQESSPAELILNFAERKSVPSEINLNKMFRRFGPLMESETEVDHEIGRAKVIFKRGSDAEVAHNSAEKFNIFGPVLVNYQIGYSPVISVKISPLALPQFPEDATLMI